MRASHAIDIKCCDNEGKSWDLSDVHRRNQVVRFVLETKPVLLIGSLMRTMFSILQNLFKDKQDDDEYNVKWKEAMSHVKFCLQLYETQHSSGRYYLHEHPDTATSWKVPEMNDFICKFSIDFARSHMCAFGMKDSG